MALRFTTYTLCAREFATESAGALKHRIAYCVDGCPSHAHHLATLIRDDIKLGAPALGRVSRIPLSIQIETNTISRCYHWLCYWGVSLGSDYLGFGCALSPLAKQENGGLDASSAVTLFDDFVGALSLTTDVEHYLGHGCAL